MIRHLALIQLQCLRNSYVTSFKNWKPLAFTFMEENVMHWYFVLLIKFLCMCVCNWFQLARGFEMTHHFTYGEALRPVALWTVQSPSLGANHACTFHTTPSFELATTVSWLVCALSPVSHRGLHQGYWLQHQPCLFCCVLVLHKVFLAASHLSSFSQSECHKYSTPQKALRSPSVWSTRFQTKPSKWVMVHTHWWREVSVAIKWSKLHSFYDWVQTFIIVHSTSQHSTAWWSDWKLVRP